MTATLVSAKTGEILATTQRPTFDADTKEGLTKDFVWRDILYQSNYEPRVNYEGHDTSCCY